MLAFSQPISVCVWAKDLQTGPLAKFMGLLPSFWAFSLVLGPSTQWSQRGLQGELKEQNCFNDLNQHYLEFQSSYS